MKKKNFRSQLYRKEILENDPEYWIKAYAELLFRISEMEQQNCNCFKCQNDLSSYRQVLKKLRNDIRIFYLKD